MTEVHSGVVEEGSKGKSTRAPQRKFVKVQLLVISSWVSRAVVHFHSKIIKGSEKLDHTSRFTFIGLT